MERRSVWDSRWRTSVIGSAGLLLTAYACNGPTGGSSDSDGAGGSGSGGASVSTSAASGGTGAGGTGGSASTSGGTDAGGTGGSASTGGGTAGEGGDIGQDGEGGTAPTTSTGGSGGAAGAPAEVCELESEPPDETCEYPESFGGGSDSAACGVTPGAWYGLGDSAPTTWPERDLSDWSSSAGVPTLTAKVGDYQLAFDPDGLPVVLWQDELSANEFAMRVRRWDGAGWVDLEPYPVHLHGVAFDLAVDSAGRVIVAERALGLVQVLRYEDSEWVPLGEWAPDLYSWDYQISLALDDQDRPTVLYDGVRLMRWTGSAWEGLGGSEIRDTITPYGVGDIALALRPNGDPVVAWAGDWGVGLEHWDGDSWEELGGSATDGGLGAAEDDGVALAIDAANQIVVAWSGQYRVWDGSAWSSAEEVGGYRPRLARGAEGDLYLLTDGDTVRERQFYSWQADAWVPLAGLTAEYDEVVDLATGPNGHVGAAFGYSYVRYAAYGGDDWTEQPTVTGAEGTLSRAALKAGPMLVDGCTASVWNGASWDVFGAPTDVESCQFAQNAHGVLHLAYWILDRNLSVHLHVARHGVDGWEVLGDPATTNPSDDTWTASSLLGFDAAGNPVVVTRFDGHVAWTDVSRWSGADWVHLDGPGLGAYEWPLGFAVTHDSRAVIASDEIDGEWERRNVFEWTGDAWRKTTVASRHRDTDPEWPDTRFVLDDAGAPVLVSMSDSGLAVLKEVDSEWKQVAPTEELLDTLPRHVRVGARSEGGEAFFRYFADCAWHGLSASDHGGGVSNSVASSTLASVGVSESEVCVAWADQLEDGDRMLLRCHEW